MIKFKNKKLLYIFSVLLILLLVFRIYYVNTTCEAYPETNIVGMNEWVELSGSYFNSINEETDGYSLMVSDSYFYTYEEFAEKFDISDDYFAESSKLDVLIVELDIKNTDNETGGIYFRGFTILNETMSYYFDYNDSYMQIANPSIPSKLDYASIQPNTEFTLYLCYTLQYGAEMLDFLELYEVGEEIKMFLPVSVYPVKNYIEVNTVFE